MIVDEVGLKEGFLQNRLNIIIQEVPYFWEQGPHSHFTYHGPSHSERVHRQKLAQLAQELPEHSRLTQDEIFIVSAAAWLYEIGMQCTSLRPIVDIDWQPGVSLSSAQLQQIRDYRHLLTHRMIIDSVRPDYDGPRLRLGLLRPDDYTQLIAEVCRWCSNDPIGLVPEQLPVSGLMVRVRLLVALLRLADQLYVDSSRVNLDLLQVANLAPKQEARWWAYHYTQTLPIDRGRIRFHYFLPSVHRPLLRHIRALIEPDFRYESNPIIQYLFEQGLKLMPHNEPSVRYDQPAGFQREMSQKMVMYLRHTTPIIDEQEPGERNEGEAAGQRSLLVLDYENFILQLGLEGYFPNQEEISRLFVTLLREAMNQFAGLVKGLAVGHWERPDLLPIAGLLKARVYELLTIENHEKSSVRLLEELNERLQSAKLPKQVLLVAPHQDLAPIVMRFDERRQAISAWIVDTPDTYIYHALVQSIKTLPLLLGLSATQKMDPDELEMVQAACILRLENGMASDKNGISFDEASAVLKQVESIKGKLDWWQLWLINKEILKPELSDKGHVLKMKMEHPDVAAINTKRTAIIIAMQSLAQDSQNVQQESLIEELRRQPYFWAEREKIVQFLGLLKDENTVHFDAHPSSLDGQPSWQLNTADLHVVTLNAGRYLPLLVLGLDHFMVREGFPVIHEHTLARRLGAYIGDGAAEAVYQLALNGGWVQRRESTEKHKYRTESLVEVELAEDNEEVKAVMLNRDILLDVLYHKSSGGGLQRDALWFTLNQIRRCTLKRDDMNQWLSIFQRESLLSIEADPHDIGRDCLRLNLESPLVQRLLGRTNVCGTVLTFRIMRATNPQMGKAGDEVVEGLARRVTRGNRQMAAWALDYAKSIRLVEFTRPITPSADHDLIFLKKHRVVYKLDQREPGACQGLAELVGMLSRQRFRDGWVPRPVLIQEMEKNSQFGYTRGEYDYWVNQAIHRRKLDIKTEPGRPPQTFICVSSQEHR